MISNKDISAVAQLVCYTYVYGLWPMGTFIFGFEDAGILWPLIAALPMIAYTALDERKRNQEKPKPESFLLVYLPMLLVIVPVTYGIYYLGVFVNYMVN